MKQIEVAAAIIKDQNKVLATQRGYGAQKGGWEFPGGKIEPLESKEHAIVREIQEELDITVLPMKLLKTIEYDYPTFHITMYCLLCNIVEGSIVLKEHSDAKWITYKELDTVDWLPADKQVIDALKADMLQDVNDKLKGENELLRSANQQLRKENKELRDQLNKQEDINDDQLNIFDLL